MVTFESHSSPLNPLNKKNKFVNKQSTPTSVIVPIPFWLQCYTYVGLIALALKKKKHFQVSFLKMQPTCKHASSYKIIYWRFWIDPVLCVIFLKAQ